MCEREGFDGPALTHMVILMGCSMLLGIHGGNLIHPVRTGISLKGDYVWVKYVAITMLLLPCHCKGEARV